MAKRRSKEEIPIYKDTCKEAMRLAKQLGYRPRNYREAFCYVMAEARKALKS